MREKGIRIDRMGAVRLGSDRGAVMWRDEWEQRTRLVRRSVVGEMSVPSGLRIGSRELGI